MHRLSTNVKLAQIINAKNNDDEEEEAVLNNEYLAKQRLRRSALYDGGARTKIPKIKKIKSKDKSPYTILGAPSGDITGTRPYEHSIPPGAHTDMFRLVTNNTKRSFNDPDRIFINSTKMDQGINYMPQPPWYVGTTNKIKPVDESYFVSASRYGFRGSKSIQQYCTAPWDLPSKTITEHTPKFLTHMDNYINEWVPPIIAAKHQTINNMETPKLWPINTIYPTGYKHKELPKSNNWFYKRETTVDLIEKPTSSKSLASLMNHTIESNEKMKTLARMESSKEFLSLPMVAQEEFSKTWDEKVKENASNSLKYNLKRNKPIYEAHTLMDPSDTIKYSGSTAMIVHTQSTEELKFRLRMERSKEKSKTPYHVKWQHMIIHYNTIVKKLPRGVTMKEMIHQIAKTLQNIAIKNGSETSLRRIDFIKACQNIPCFEEISTKQLSVLYSLFDPMKRNSMRFVEIIGVLTVLDHPEQLPYEKLKSLWKIYFEYGLDRNIFDIVLEILSCCVYSVPDCDVIEKLFREEFRLKAYELSMGLSAIPCITSVPSTAMAARIHTAEIQQNEREKIALEKSNKTLALIKAIHDKPSDKNDDDDENDDNDHNENQIDIVKENALVIITNDNDDNNNTNHQQKTMSVQPQYNICDYYLNEQSFIDVLHLCPNLIVEFDNQLKEKLILCYGKDDRYYDPNTETSTVSTQDFSWIMKKTAPKKEVFGLYE